MDMYGSLSSTPECVRIDDLLNFPNDDFSADDLFSYSSASAAATCSSSSSDSNHHLPSLQNQAPTPFFNNAPSFSYSDFPVDLCVPNDDATELEWLSQFVDDSFNGLPEKEITGSTAFRPETSFPARARSKRPKATEASEPRKSNPKTETSKGYSSSPSSAAGEEGVRRCTHCASEKTPQWRTGPLGPKTLCNACGVRYKSGRLVPEYRPAASPTFVLTQHSNSHRKVLELRRQKEELLRQKQEQQEQGQSFLPLQDLNVW